MERGKLLLDSAMGSHARRARSERENLKRLNPQGQSTDASRSGHG